jgi:hypothetical protein
VSSDKEFLVSDRTNEAATFVQHKFSLDEHITESSKRSDRATSFSITLIGYV